MALVLVLAVPITVGVITGYLFGGRLLHVVDLHLRAFWLVWTAAAIHALSHLHGPVQDAVTTRYGWSLGFAPVLIWLAVNAARFTRRQRSAIAVLAVGAAANLTAILANGRMPYRASSSIFTEAVSTARNQPAGAQTRLAVLGDIWPIPPLNAVISLGDLLLAIGVVALIVTTMREIPVPPVHHPSEETGNDEIDHPADRVPTVRHRLTGRPALQLGCPDDRGQLTGRA